MNCIDALEVDRSVPASTDPAIGARGTVLIVTGDENFSAVASRVLRREGYGVVTASHAGHAILAALTTTHIDVIIADLHLDNMSGERLAATLRRHHPRLRSLFMTRHAALKQDGVLVHPFTRDELLVELDGTPVTDSAVSPAS
jgi:CheY-like chemotaxis protein